jgi:hypothetical protein
MSHCCCYGEGSGVGVTDYWFEVYCSTEEVIDSFALHLSKCSGFVMCPSASKTSASICSKVARANLAPYHQDCTSQCRLDRLLIGVAY